LLRGADEAEVLLIALPNRPQAAASASPWVCAQVHPTDPRAPPLDKPAEGNLLVCRSQSIRNVVIDLCGPTAIRF
jgi:hypothetical protein